MSEQEALGKYRIEAEIGHGGFATVYRAVDALERPVALKVLDPLLSRDPAWVERFYREARATARLVHPHIVTIYEIGEAEGRLYIAMELVRGPDLRRRLHEQGPYTWAEALDLGEQIVAALDYAHGQGVVHRDIKPENVLLDEVKGVILTDFGLARLLGDSSAGTTLSGGVIGTPAYIAPEVWKGERGGVPADIYALGCLVYELVMGKPLFHGETPAAVMQKHLLEGPRFAEGWPGDAPTWVEGALRKALAMEPAERWKSAGEMFSALRRRRPRLRAEREEEDPWKVRLRLGEALLQAGRVEEALAELEQVYAQDAALAGEALARALMTQGEQYEEAGEEERALAAYRRALETVPADASLRREVEEVLARWEQRRECLRLAGEARRLEEAGAWSQAAECYGRLVDMDLERRAEWEAALARCREEARLLDLFCAGRAALERGDWAAARPALRELVQCRPEYERDGLMAAEALVQAVRGVALTPTPLPPSPSPAPRERGRGVAEGRGEGVRAGPENIAELLALPQPPARIWWEKAGMELCLVPAGEFLMGSAEDDGEAASDEKPQRRVYLSAYYIGRYPVTNAQYARFVQETGHEAPAHWEGGKPPAGKEEHPVVNVSWHDAVAYCRWAGLRLPTEAQWEKAARGTDGRKYPWGNKWDAARCNSAEGGAGGTTPVGAYSPEGDSPYGCADMAGNVWEWCVDWYDGGYYARSPKQDPRGPESGKGRVMRGGSWYDVARWVRAANRLSYGPSDWVGLLGFRCVVPARGTT